MFSHCSPLIFPHFTHICQHWWPVAVRHLRSFIIITHIMQLQDEHLSWWHYPWLPFNMKSEKPIQELSLSHWTLLNLKRALRDNYNKKIILCISSLHRTVGDALSHVYVCNSCRCVVVIHLGFSTLCTFPHAITPVGITYPWTPPTIEILPRCQNSTPILPFQKPFPTTTARSASSISCYFLSLSTTFLTVPIFCLIACEQSIPLLNCGLLEVGNCWKSCVHFCAYYITEYSISSW